MINMILKQKKNIDKYINIAVLLIEFIFYNKKEQLKCIKQITMNY